MKIEYRTGDLMSTDVLHIIHGCNSRGAMNSGVAYAVRNTYPKAYDDYRCLYNSYGLIVGNVHPSLQPNGKTVWNAITQDNYGRDVNKVYVSYKAIADCFSAIDGEMEEIAMPLIGSGLANGDWKVISAIIENTLVKTKPIAYML